MPSINASFIIADTKDILSILVSIPKTTNQKAYKPYIVFGTVMARRITFWIRKWVLRLGSILGSFLLVFLIVSNIVSDKQDFSTTILENENNYLRLGDTSYFMDTISAPILKGRPLHLLSWVATRSIVGPFFLRILLNKNGVSKLRQLVDQMNVNGGNMPPLHYPLYQMSPSERNRHDKIVQQAIQEQKDLESIIPFVLNKDVLDQLQESSTILQLYSSYETSQTTPTKVAQTVLEAIQKLNPIYKPFSSDPNVEEILAAAKASTERYERKSQLSIFDGIPVAFKDMLAIKGYYQTNGSSYKNARNNSPAQTDDLIVRRFRELGAIVLPPTSMTEYGVTPVGYSVYNKGPVNAYNTSHYSGGSSGGSSTAVALGICPIAIGYDGGGSVRTPASFSGVYGMATGFGRFVFQNNRASTMIKSGVFGTNVADVLLGYAVLARDLNKETDWFSKMYDGGVQGLPKAHFQSLMSSANENEQNEPKEPSKSYKELSDVTIGVWYEWIEDASPPVVAATKSMLEGLVAKGAKIKEFRIPNLNMARLAHSIKIATEFAVKHDRAYHDRTSNLEPNTRITIGLGLAMSAVEIQAADKLRRYLFEYIHDLFVNGNIDVIVTPTVSMSAPIIPEGARDYGASNTPLSVELLKYIFLGNLLGMPGMSNPIGYDETNAGMPIGGLVTAWQWNEDKIFRISKAIEDDVVQKRIGRDPNDKICLTCIIDGV